MTDTTTLDTATANVAAAIRHGLTLAPYGGDGATPADSVRARGFDDAVIDGLSRIAVTYALDHRLGGEIDTASAMEICGVPHDAEGGYARNTVERFGDITWRLFGDAAIWGIRGTRMYWDTEYELTYVMPPIRMTAPVGRRGDLPVLRISISDSEALSFVLDAPYLDNGRYDATQQELYVAYLDGWETFWETFQQVYKVDRS